MGPGHSCFRMQVLVHFSCYCCLDLFKLFYFEHPHPLLVEILWGWALRGHSGVGHSRKNSGAGHSGNTLKLGTPERLWVWVLRAKDTATPRRLWGWALQGNSGIGLGTRRVWYSGWALQETLGLGTPDRYKGWALGDTHFRETLELGTGQSGVGNSGRLYGETLGLRLWGLEIP